MTEFEKVLLAERLYDETGVEIFPQIRRRDWKTSKGDPSPCGVALTRYDGSLTLFLSDNPYSDGEHISAEDFETEYQVVCLSFE